MKHIKPFNENTYQNPIEQQELKNFCETHLAYLLDDDNFELKVDTFQIRLENKFYHPRFYQSELEKE